VFVVYWLFVGGTCRFEFTKVYKNFGNDEEWLENQRKGYAKILTNINNALNILQLAQRCLLHKSCYK